MIFSTTAQVLRAGQSDPSVFRRREHSLDQLLRVEFTPVSSAGDAGE